MDFDIDDAVEELNGLIQTNVIPFDSHCFLDEFLWLTNNSVLQNIDLLDSIQSLRDSKKRFLASVMSPVNIYDAYMIIPTSFHFNFGIYLYI